MEGNAHPDPKQVWGVYRDFLKDKSLFCIWGSSTLPIDYILLGQQHNLLSKLEGPHPKVALKQGHVPRLWTGWDIHVNAGQREV